MAEGNEEVVGMVIKLAAESTGFQDQMTTLNREMKVIQSEYKATAASSTDFDKSMDGLAAKCDYLTKAMETQQQIVDAHASKLENSKSRLEELAIAQDALTQKMESTKSAYEEEVRLNGEDSTAAKELAYQLQTLQAEHDKNNDKINATSKTIDNQTISYNNARATLGSFQTQLDSAQSSMENMKSGADNVNGSMDSLEGHGNPLESFTSGIASSVGNIEIFGVKLGDIGSAMSGAINPADLLSGAVAGISAKLTEMAVEAIVNAVKAIGQMVGEMANAGDTIDKTSQKMSISAESFQRWESIAGHNGSSIQSYATIMKKLADTTEKNAASFKELGVECENTDGTIKSQEQIFQETVIALASMEDGTERNRLANDLFGKQYTELLPLINSGAQGIRDQIEASKDAVVMTDEYVKASARLCDANQAVSEQVTGVKNNLVGGLLEPLAMIKESFANLLITMQPIFDAIGTAIGTIAQYVAIAVTNIIDTVNAIIQPISAVFQVVTDCVKSFTGPIFESLRSSSKGYTDELKSVFGSFADFIKSLGNVITPVVGIIGNLIAASINLMQGQFEEAFTNFNNIADIATGKIVDTVETGVEDVNQTVSDGNDELANLMHDVCDGTCTTFDDMYKRIQEMDDETYGKLKDNAEEYKNEYEIKADALTEFERDKSNEMMKAWEKTNENRTKNLDYYMDKAEHQATVEAALHNKTAKEREKLEKEYTGKIEKEMIKQENIYKKSNNNKYKDDYEMFAKNEEAKTAKFKEELAKRQEQSNVGTSILQGITMGISTAIRGYATGTNFHPGGLSIVGEKGPELMNVQRGSSISTNTDTASMLKNANADVVSEISSLRNDVSMLASMIRNNAMQEAAVIGLNS